VHYAPANISLRCTFPGSIFPYSCLSIIMLIILLQIQHYVVIIMLIILLQIQHYVVIIMLIILLQIQHYVVIRQKLCYTQ